MPLANWSTTAFSKSFQLVERQMQSFYSWINENTMPPDKVFWLKLQIQKENTIQHASNVAKISHQFQVTLQNKLIRVRCLPVYMLLITQWYFHNSFYFRNNWNFLTFLEHKWFPLKEHGKKKKPQEILHREDHREIHINCVTKKKMAMNMVASITHIMCVCVCTRVFISCS